MAQYGATAKVRKFAVEAFFEPARRRGDRTVSIHSGQLAKTLEERSLLLPNSYPIVCSALNYEPFARENHVTLEKVETSAPSGKSSTVTFTFRLNQLPSSAAEKTDQDFLALRGILKDAYARLGGIEAFHKAERESWEQ
jgi:hypothetical protein